MRLKQIIYNQLLTIQYIFGRTKQYHIGSKKSRFLILRDLMAWQFHEGEFNTMFYALGLHLSGSKQREYIGRKSFLTIKNRTEKILKQKAGCENLNYNVITKDKFYANSIFTANGIPCIENFALISGSNLIFPNGKNEKIESILDLKDSFFIKNLFLEAGEGVYSFKIVNKKVEMNGKQVELNNFLHILKNKKYIIQRKYISHKSLLKINSSALNTTRIVTILDYQEPKLLCGFQAFATGNALTDSWSHGSIYVGIDFERECLKEYGITSVSDKCTGLIREHPDSGVIFKDYKIPFLKQAVELCIRAHNLLYFNFIIGWDVAITDFGPLIVEANEKPGMNVAQTFNGGLRNKILWYSSKIRNEN